MIPWQETRLRAVAFDRTRAFLAGRKRWRRLPRTFTGFADALVSTQRPLADAIWNRLRAQVRAVAPDAFRECFGDRDFLVLAADGSRFETPRTAANEAAFGSAGRRGTGPQVAATVLYHLGTGLPYAARLGSGTDSELRHLDAMLDELPDRTLLLADAGFPHFDLLQRLHADGHAFLMRVGADRTLLAELNDPGACERSDGRFGPGRQVWLWPQAKRDRPPLSLRQIEIETERPDVPNVYIERVYIGEPVGGGPPRRAGGGVVPPAAGRGGLLSDRRADAAIAVAAEPEPAAGDVRSGMADPVGSAAGPADRRGGRRRRRRSRVLVAGPQFEDGAAPAASGASPRSTAEPPAEYRTGRLRDRPPPQTRPGASPGSPSKETRPPAASPELRPATPTERQRAQELAATSLRL